MKKSTSINTEIVIFQTKLGKINFRGDLKKETLWATQAQIADLFETDKSGISRHVNNIFNTGELDRNSTVAKIATVQIEGKRPVKRSVEYFNLDLILSVGYRVNSKTATKFRQWATKTLRQHIIKGYTINKDRLDKNYHEFLETVDTIKALLPSKNKVRTSDALELVKMFASTWFSLDAYDKSELPAKGASKKQVQVSAEELTLAISELKQNLIGKHEATELFGQTRQKDTLSGIVGNVFQSAFGKDAYESLEEKAAHLLYFIVKNHPFIDGNKRSGAFAFIWFLNKVGLLRKDKLTPEALTALTLLVAESNPKDKEKAIGLILQLLKKQ